MASRLHFLSKIDRKDLARLAKPDETILIYDRTLARRVPGFKKLIGNYRHAFPVEAGEKLKSLSAFANLSETIHARIGAKVHRQWCVMAIGGGSVGDAAGFFASVYKRGLRLVQVPSTWLAAMDSAHGGKTALNLARAKNQIGSFHQASDVVLVREILLTQPDVRAHEALGELAKIVVIDGGAWTKKLRRMSVTGEGARKLDGPALWSFLRPAISAKMKVVKRDPREQSGHRQILNLGHTMGHVLEAERGLAHGAAVTQGLWFSVAASEFLFGDHPIYWELIQWLKQMGLPYLSPKQMRPLPAATVRSRLLNDKKRSASGKVTFIAIRNWGRVERVSVPVEKLVQVGREIGWVT